MRRLLHITTFATALYWVGFIGATPVAAQSQSLDSMPQATQDEISRICLPVQFREGAQAYRNCVQSELSLRSGNSQSKLRDLTFDDKYAVQQACASAGAQSSESYRQCVNNQIAELNTIAVPNLEAASEDELYAVQQTCFTAQSKEGAANYRRCLNTEIASLLTIPAADTTGLSMLNKNALQLRCSANTTRAVDYRQCIADEFESIAGTVPTLLPVSSAARVSQQQASGSSNSAVTKAVETIATQSVTNNQTLSDVSSEPTLATVETEPRTQQIDAVALAETTTQSKPIMALPRNVQPARAETNNSLSSETTALADSKVNTLRDATGNNLIAVNEISSGNAGTGETGDARIISRPALVQALEDQSREKTRASNESSPAAQSDSSKTTATTNPADPLQPIKDLWQWVLTTLGSLDRIGWMILAGVLLLPILLLGLFSLTRRSSRKDEMPLSNPSLTERIEPGLQTRKLKHEREAAELFENDVMESDLTAPLSSESTAIEQPAAYQPADERDSHMATPHSAEADSLPSEEATRFAQKPDLTTTPGLRSVDNMGDAEKEHNQWQSAFGHWLTRKPEEDRLGHCIEFLIYWVAYGDDRYEPELKKQLFTAVDLNDHDQIKRWVLKQDVFAFADVVNWVRNNASKLQHEQIIGLIMALLVTENSVTPVQNTLLRFFADTFDLGKDTLEQNFQTAFGHALPPVPRVDKLAWWEKQSPNELERWNSRAIAKLPVKQQMLARLGFTQPQNESEVINSFRRAARRCHPDRFTALGERERAMAERRFAKFEEARDRLLGVSV